jgi:membrane fusion protein (multidrug efflux system)
MNDPTPHPRRRRRFLLTVAAAVVVAAFFALRGRGGLGPGKAEASASPAAAANGAGKKDAKAKEPPAVAVRPVEVGPISAFLSATANLVAEDEVKVVAEAEGKVVRLLVEEGDGVAAGQTLVQIDPAEAALAVQRAELGLRNAQMNLERAQTMAAEELISPEQLDKNRYERDVAAQALAEARHRLKKTTVTAPFAARITVRRVQPGQNVKLGEELFTLADFDPLVARIFLPEREVLDLKVGQDVRLVLRAREETRFQGRIRQISPVVDTTSGTVKITVEAVRPPASVRPGAFVAVEVLRETRPKALLVPKAAVIRELQETYLFVVDGTVARKREVDLGLEEGDRLEVVRGVAAGESVITAGQGGLKDGATVAVAQASPAPAPSPTRAAKGE